MAAGPLQATTNQPRLRAEDLPDGLDLVILFGSRARGNAAPTSDWDLAVRFRQQPDSPLCLYGLDPELARVLGTSSDDVDVVDLTSASYLLQRVVAQEGLPLFERRPGLFANFCSRAIRQWADWQCRGQRLGQGNHPLTSAR